MSCYHYHILERRKAHRGFTLIELLVVIVIIGILASMIVVAVNSARTAARRAIIKTQIAQVEGALAQYLKTYGEYPPDFSDEAAVMRHLRKRWPKWQGGPKDIAEFCDAINAAAGYDFSMATVHGTTKSRGAHIGALAFWLGGIPDSNGLLNGFSADISDPLGLNGSITQWDKDSQFMELTIGNNCDIIDGLPVITANGYPIVYFKPNAAGKYWQKGTEDDPMCFHIHYNAAKHPPTWEYLGDGVPYAKSVEKDKNDIVVNVVWHNPKTYQLIHPGLDGKFGDIGQDEDRVIDPANDVAVNITLADKDNQANFGGTTIESAGN